MSEVFQFGSQDEQPLTPNIPPRRSVMDVSGLPAAPRFESTFTRPIQSQPQVSRESAFTRDDLKRLSSSLESEQELVPAATDEELLAAYQSGQQEVLGGQGYGGTDIHGGIHIRRSHTTTEDVIVESVRPDGKLPTSIVHLLGATPLGTQLPELPSTPDYGTYAPEPSFREEAVTYAPSTPAPVVIPPVAAPLTQEDNLSDVIFGQTPVETKPDVRNNKTRKEKTVEIPHRFRRASALILAPLLAGGLVISDWSNFSEGMHYIGKEVGLTTRGAASVNFGTVKEAIHIFASGDTTKKG